MKRFNEYLLEMAQDAHKHGYEFHVIPNYPKGHHTIIATHPSSLDTMSTHELGPSTVDKVPAHLRGRVVGLAAIRHTGVETNDQIAFRGQPSSVYVKPTHRRNGIGSAMYNKYEEHTGHAVIPSSSQSDDAKALWRDRSK